jgi:large subunit ribosomal protein L21
MYAVIKTGGKQYKVAKGTVLWIEMLHNKEVGEVVDFNDVLMVSDGDQLAVGPQAKATVSGKVLGQGKDKDCAHGRKKKIIVFKQIRRKRYRRIYGHRQYYTAIEITDIKTA